VRGSGEQTVTALPHFLCPRIWQGGSSLQSAIAEARQIETRNDQRRWSHVTPSWCSGRPHSKSAHPVREPPILREPLAP